MTQNLLLCIREEIERLLDTRSTPHASDAFVMLDRAASLSLTQRALVELIVTTLFPDHAELLARAEALGNGALAPAQIASGMLQEANQPHFMSPVLYRLYGTILAWLDARFDARGAAELVEHGRVHLGVLARLTAHTRRGNSTDVADQARATSSLKKIQSLYGRFFGNPKKPLARMLIDLPWLSNELMEFERPRRATTLVKKLRPTPRIALLFASSAACLVLLWLVADLTNALRTVVNGDTGIGRERGRSFVVPPVGSFRPSSAQRSNDRSVIEQLRVDLDQPGLVAQLQGDYPAIPTWIILATDNNEQELAAELTRVAGLNVLERGALQLNVHLPSSAAWFQPSDLELLAPLPLKSPVVARILVLSCGPTDVDGQSRITIREARTHALVYSGVGQSMRGEVSLTANHYLSIASEVYQEGKGDGVLAELLLRMARAAAEDSPAQRAECDYLEAGWHATHTTAAAETQAKRLYLRAIPGLVDADKKATAKQYVALKRRSDSSVLRTGTTQEQDLESTAASSASVSPAATAKP